MTEPKKAYRTYQTGLIILGLLIVGESILFAYEATSALIERDDKLQEITLACLRTPPARSLETCRFLAKDEAGPYEPSYAHPASILVLIAGFMMVRGRRRAWFIRRRPDPWETQYAMQRR